MAFPNFLVIGVPKAGTTSLYHYLRQHPQIALSSIREPKYLLYAGYARFPHPEIPPILKVTSRDEYEALYAGNEQRSARGDISPIYLMYPDQTIPGIVEYVPDVSMIVIYRQPADRAYSDFLMHIRLGNETIHEFSRALAAEKAGILRVDRRPRFYIDRGYYAHRTRAFLEAFPRDRFLFMLYDDLERNPVSFLQTILRFIGVDPEIVPNMETRHAAAEWPRNEFLHRLVNLRNPVKRGLARLLPVPWRAKIHSQINGWNFHAPPPVEPGLRQELTRQYREDILSLQELIDRDLSGWITES